MEYEALDDFTELHGYCIEGCTVTEVSGASWPTTAREAETLVNEANWTGSCAWAMGTTPWSRMRRWRFAIPSTSLASGSVGPSYAEIASEWAFTVIEVQNAEGFQMWTDNLLDLVSRALEYHEEGERKALEAVWLAMVDMGLKDSHPALGEAMAAMEA